MSKSTPTTLQERIARLGLQDGASSNASAPSAGTSSTPSPQSTGAKGRISDKIARYQANATHESPLVPLGSFGLGGVPRPSGQASVEKGRVASLGGGRAKVPLGVVTKGARSVSEGVPRSEGSSSVRDNDDGVVTPPLSSPSLSTHGIGSMPMSSPSLSSELAPSDGATTPVSVSSVNVETGSMRSMNISTPVARSVASSSSVRTSPLSSPIIDAAVIEEQPPLMPLRTALTSLQTPARSGSVLSMASMLVETGSSVSLDGAETESLAEEGKIPSVIGSDRGASDETESTGTQAGRDENKERERTARTEQELQAYEHDTNDPAAPPSTAGTLSTPLDSVPEFGRAPSPILSTFPPLQGETEHYERKEPEEGDPLAQTVGLAPTRMRPISHEQDKPVVIPETDYLDEAPSAFEPASASLLPPITVGSAASQDASSADVAPPSPGLPKVKCSDCGTELDLMELMDHNCAPSSKAPALSSPKPSSPMSPIATSSSTHKPPESPLKEPDRSSSRGSSKFAKRMDEFVAHTSSLVPDDVIDEDEDVDGFARGAARDSFDQGLDSPLEGASFSHIHSASREAFDLPEDVDDPLDAGPAAQHEPAPVTTASQISGAQTSLSAKPKQHVKNTSRGRLPDDTDEEEDGYEGGSVTIVRTSR